ncbi:MAG: DUF423 domain-containing protein [Planctomycetota bacterium]
MISAGAILGALGIAAGAFGAHALDETLSPEDMEIFETGARYQIYHALALLLCAGLPLGGRCLSLAAHAFTWGTVIFSGSLYLLVLTGPRALGAVTPIGGSLMILGWLCLLGAGLGICGREQTSEFDRP